MTDSNDPSDADDLAGRSILIAGATGGLGSALASALAGRGATLTLVARSRERLDALPVAGHRIPLDLRDPRACAAAVSGAVERAGRLDAVVNAVGVVAFGPVDELDMDIVEELFLTNTFIPIALAKSALSALDPGGVIMNLSGVIAEQNLPGMAAYGASKAAVASFDAALGREARRRKISVIDARPPHTETGLAGRAIAGTAPKMPTGLDPAAVAAVLAEAIASALDGRHSGDLPSTSFA